MSQGMVTTGPNSWLIWITGDISTAVAAIKQVASKRHVIKSIYFTGSNSQTITISDGTDATADQTILQVQHVGTNASVIPMKLIKGILLDVNKSLVVGSSAANGVSVIIEGETI